MAATGIALALALADTGLIRAPAFAILAFAWIGAGLLVPMLAYLLLSSALSSDAPAQSTHPGSELPGWEAVMIQMSFAGLGLALAVALPLYLLKHWSSAFTGRLGDRTSAPGPAALVAMSAAVLVAAVQGFWAAGGRWGLAHPAARELDWSLQLGNGAGWALLGAGGVWMLARRRPSSVPVWLPLAITWVVSGFLVCWSAWRLPFVVLAAHGITGGTVWPEQLLVEAVVCLLSIVAGAAMVLTTRTASGGRVGVRRARQPKGRSPGRRFSSHCSDATFCGGDPS
jgi:hypothetical protein